MRIHKAVLGSFVVLAGLAALAAGAVIQAQDTSPQAATPLGSGFTYQGRLDKNSVPVDDTCDFRFSLYDGPGQGDTQVGADQAVDDVPVVEGLFNVVLDTAGQFGNAFGGDARWLETEVQCPGDVSFEVVGRQQLTATPYSLHSTSTGSLRGQPLSGAAPAAGQVLEWNGTAWAPATDNEGSGGISQINSGTGIAVANGSGPIATISADLAFLGSQPFSGGGPLAGQVLKWTGTAWAPGTDLEGTPSGGGVGQINAGAGITVTNGTGPTATVAADLPTLDARWLNAVGNDSTTGILTALGLRAGTGTVTNPNCSTDDICTTDRVVAEGAVIGILRVFAGPPNFALCGQAGDMCSSNRIIAGDATGCLPNSVCAEGTVRAEGEISGATVRAGNFIGCGANQVCALEDIRTLQDLEVGGKAVLGSPSHSQCAAVGDGSLCVDGSVTVDSAVFVGEGINPGCGAAGDVCAGNRLASAGQVRAAAVASGNCNGTGDICAGEDLVADVDLFAGSTVRAGNVSDALCNGGDLCATDDALIGGQVRAGAGGFAAACDANGDICASQDVVASNGNVLAGGFGTAKAGAFFTCMGNPAAGNQSSITRSFAQLGSVTVTDGNVIAGTVTTGNCTISPGFTVSGRFVVAMPFGVVDRVVQVLAMDAFNIVVHVSNLAGTSVNDTQVMLLVY